LDNNSINAKFMRLLTLWNMFEGRILDILVGE